MLKNLINKNKKQSGFTIIEVMIVLAIAGLILVVVLIAVPQLQRNQRNSARQTDASRLATSVANWSANNQGAVFTAGTGNANITALLNDLGTFSQYDAVVGTISVATGNTNAHNSTGTMVIVTGAKCGTSGATVAGTSRQFAIKYATETNSGTPQGQCVES